MFRRSLLLCTAAIPAALALSACTQTPSVSSVTSDVSLITTAIANVLPNVPNAPAALATYLSEIKSLASSISSNASLPSATTMQQFVSDVQAFANIAAPLIPSASLYLTAINDALALLPGLLAAVGVASGTPTANAIPPDQARAALHAFVGH